MANILGFEMNFNMNSILMAGGLIIFIIIFIKLYSQFGSGGGGHRVNDRSPYGAEKRNWGKKLRAKRWAHSLEKAMGRTRSFSHELLKEIDMSRRLAIQLDKYWAQKEKFLEAVQNTNGRLTADLNENFSPGTLFNDEHLVVCVNRVGELRTMAQETGAKIKYQTYALGAFKSRIIKIVRRMKTQNRDFKRSIKAADKLQKISSKLGAQAADITSLQEVKEQAATQKSELQLSVLAEGRERAAIDIDTKYRAVLKHQAEGIGRIIKGCDLFAQVSQIIKSNEAKDADQDPKGKTANLFRINVGIETAITLIFTSMRGEELDMKKALRKLESEAFQFEEEEIYQETGTAHGRQPLAEHALQSAYVR
ncbi:MAG: hypothetical protein ABIC95_05780 [archaeon]